MFKNILVATDGSEAAHRAVQTAADLAGKYDAQLHVLHVMLHGEQPKSLRHMAEVENLANIPTMKPVVGDDMPARVRADGEISDHRLDHEALAILSNRILEGAVVTAEKAGAEKITTHAADGDPATRILDMCDQTDSQLIVMGSRGLGRLKSLLVGSVSQKVGQMSECCCLTVR